MSPRRRGCVRGGRVSNAGRASVSSRASWSPRSLSPAWRSRLTPVPAASLQQDSQLRNELGAPDVRYLVTLQGGDVESVLQQSERLVPVLDRLRAQHAIAGYDLAARYMPSAA